MNIVRTIEQWYYFRRVYTHDDIIIIISWEFLATVVKNRAIMGPNARNP